MISKARMVGETTAVPNTHGAIFWLTGLELADIGDGKCSLVTLVEDGTDYEVRITIGAFFEYFTAVHFTAVVYDHQKG